MLADRLKNYSDKLQGSKLVKSFNAIPELILSRVDPLYHRRFRFHTAKNYLQSWIRYDAPPDPYKTIEIQPSQIEQRISWVDDTKPLHRVRDRGIARIKSGDWDADKNKTNVDETYIISGLAERFEQDRRWDETTYYTELRERFKHDDKYKNVGFDKVENYLQSRFRSYDALYEEIQSNGYKEYHIAESRQPGKAQPVSDKLEVLVSIDRCGTVHLFEGHHRFAIARVLDIEIPAHVVCRHKQWQELRDDVYKIGVTDERAELRDHPDLQDVIY